MAMIMSAVPRLLARLAALLMLAGFAGVAAQSWPSRPVTLIVSQAPGTAPDFIARTLSVRMGERLKVGVIVDNRGGASGNIGAEYVAKAAPDGYTLYLAPSSFIMGSTISRNPRFDPIKSFASVLPLADGLQCLVVSGTSPIRSVKELVARAKASPAKLFYATPGNGTAHHFIMEQFKMEAGMDLVHVPYKGLPGAIVDLIAGRVDVMMMTTAAAAAHVQSGQLRMLAVVSPSRSPLSPDMPTLAEQGYPHVRGASWYGLLAPAGTPSEVLARLNTEMNAILAEKPVRDAFAKQGLEATGGAALRLAEAMASERELWRKIAELTGISAE
ncbi:MAG: tripartite tricarboxylate transporter substrate binding protein [Betaproteobacteria bacterium]|nr:tripartite tricarboxylate transporter substrate binding protein [Betaproteobacteria bacterium]